MPLTYGVCVGDGGPLMREGDLAVVSRIGGDRPRAFRPSTGDVVKTTAKSIAIAAVASLAVLATLGEASSSGESDTSSAAAETEVQAEDNAGTDSAAEEESAETAEEESADAQDWYVEEFGTFEPVTEKGKGDGIVTLPAGAEYGLVTASHKGSANFSLAVLDEANQPTLDLLVNTIGNYKGTTAYGFSSLGDPPAKIKVSADGAWTVEVAPISTAPELTLPAEAKGDKVYLYGGPAGDWNVAHKGKGNFSVIQHSTDIMPNLAVNEIGSYKGQVPMTAGPSVVVVGSDGAWTIAE